MAKSRKTIGKAKPLRRKSRAARKRSALKTAQPRPPSRYTATFNALAPLLDGKPIASLRPSRVATLAKKTGLREPDLTTLIAANKLAAKTKLPPSALFALSTGDEAIDPARLAAA